jgi:hypothetical protein
VVDIAEKPRRRTWVGESTVFTVIGARLSARVADWYLARKGYGGQQAPDLKQPMLPNNLYRPVPGDHGAHGAFDDEAVGISPRTWAIQHPGVVLGDGLGLVGVAASALARIARGR